MNTVSPPGLTFVSAALGPLAKNPVRAALMMSASHPLLLASSSIIICARCGFFCRIILPKKDVRGGRLVRSSSQSCAESRRMRSCWAGIQPPVQDLSRLLGVHVSGRRFSRPPWTACCYDGGSLWRSRPNASPTRRLILPSFCRTFFFWIAC